MDPMLEVVNVTADLLHPEAADTLGWVREIPD